MSKRPISYYFTSSSPTKKVKATKPSKSCFECLQCTFLNDDTRTRCQMCNHSLLTKATPPQTATPKITSGPNAFSYMMTKAAEKPRREYFILKKLEKSGKLVWSWAVATQDMTTNDLKNIGGPDTKWTGTCTLRDSSLDKTGSIFLATNILPTTTSTNTSKSTSSSTAVSEESRMSPLLSKDTNHWFSPSHLKSALQKNVRRKRSKSAVKCALALLRVDVIQFIRRMMIIILEDSILHPSLPLLAWLLLATSKGYIINSNTLIDAMLNIVKEVASSNCRDPDRGRDGIRENSEHTLFKDEDQTSKSLLLSSDNMSNNQNECIIKSILCRQRFGGMVGDMKMLGRYSYLWYNRLEGLVDPPPEVNFFMESNTIKDNDNNNNNNNNNTWHNFIVQVHSATRSISFSSGTTTTITTTPLPSYGTPLLPEDVLPSAIDFHCSPDILNALNTDDVDVKDIKAAMWYFSSSVNHKLNLLTGASSVDGSLKRRAALLKIWGPLQKRCIDYQKKFISSKMRSTLPRK